MTQRIYFRDEATALLNTDNMDGFSDKQVWDFIIAMQTRYPEWCKTRTLHK